MFAALKNGPAAWKWVDVWQKSTVTLDLTIDAAQTGGVEVNAPLGALGKVQLAPADEPGRPMLGQGSVERLGGPPADCHRTAFSHQPPRDRPPDPPTAAGHQRDLAIETEIHRPHLIQACGGW